MGVLVASSLLAARPSRAQGTTTPTVTQINVVNYGARDDAQDTEEIALPGGTTCTVPTTTTVSCGGTPIFVPADVGKAIQIPAAGPTVSGVVTTFVGTICALVGTNVPSSIGVVLCSPVTTTPTNPVYVTWGTDNSTAFAAAAAACPPNASASLSPFTSRGCVIVVPVSPSGTGSYMFNTAVVMSAQTSLQIIGTGNSARQEQSTQAGVRLITSANITILTIGNTMSSVGANNYGGFQLSNVTFRDTSGPASQTTVTPGSGAATGGLHMINVSEALISECSFENFDGIQTGAFTTDHILSYGMFSDPGFSGATGVVKSGFNNNIILIHDKGRNNSVFYDSSLPGQDGPIVIGGDIFPENNAFSVTGLPVAMGTHPLSGACYGFINAGPIRMYGTHIDSRVDFSGLGCVGVLMESGGILNYKNESAKDTSSGAPSNGAGVYLLGGSNAAMQAVSVTGSATSPTVTATFTGTGVTNNYVVGQLVNILGTAHYNGTFRVAAGTIGGLNFKFYDLNPPTGTEAGTATGLPTRDADVEVIVNATGPGNGVVIGAGALNNRIHIVSAEQSITTPLPPYTDLNGPPPTGDGNEIVVADAANGATFVFDGGTPANTVFQDVVSITGGNAPAGVTAIPVLSVAGGTGGPSMTAPGGAGAAINLIAGTGGATTFSAGGLGGAVAIKSGTGGSALSGSSTTAGAGGVAVFQSGGGGNATGATRTAGAGGLLEIQGGTGGSGGSGAPAGNGGSITIQAGPPGTTGGGATPGTISLLIGNSGNGLLISGASPTVIQPATSTTLLLARVASTLTTTMNGDFGYDSSSPGNWHFFVNGNDRINTAWSTTALTNGNCTNEVVSSGNFLLGDFGHPCMTLAGDLGNTYASPQVTNLSNVSNNSLGYSGLVATVPFLEIVDSTAQTKTSTGTLMTDSISGNNDLNTVNKTVRYVAGGTLGTNMTTPGAYQWTLTVAGTTVCQTGSSSPTQNLSGATWTFTCDIIVTGTGASGSVVATGTFVAETNTTNHATATQQVGSNGTVTSVNVSGTPTFALTITYGSAITGDTVTQQQATLLRMN